MRTVYIIGAGASKAIWGFPTLERFLAEGQSELQKDRKHGNPTIVEKYLSSRFGEYSKVNLEDVLTDLDNTLFGLGRMWYGSEDHPKRQIALNVRSVLIQLIRKKLAANDSFDDQSKLKEYNRILSTFQREDTVLTFNYDCGIEAYARSNPDDHPLSEQTTMWAAENLFRETLMQYTCDGDTIFSRGPRLLKLHGSLDYFACMNEVCPHKARISLACYNEMGGEHERVCHTCGGSLETVIVPPNTNKSFERFPRLSLLWRLAEQALNECERLVLWGFSCPKTDHHVAWLLRNACRNWVSEGVGIQPGSLREIVIIDPEHKHVEERLRATIDSDMVNTWQRFVDHNKYAMQA